MCECECHEFPTAVWFVLVSSNEYWRKDERATIVLPGKCRQRQCYQISPEMAKKPNKWFIWTLNGSRLPGNTILAFSSLHQYSLLLVSELSKIQKKLHSGKKLLNTMFRLECCYCFEFNPYFDGKRGLRAVTKECQIFEYLPICIQKITTIVI